MKQVVRERLSIVILTAVLISLALNLFFQLHGANRELYLNAQEKFSQIERILGENEEDIRALKENLQEDFFIRAKAAAYIVENHPEVVSDQDEMKKIASLLQVDEFHLFDQEGNLYAGSEPKYFGLNFTSGEQMQFFLPMLKDKSLRLCQEVTPNTAEQKMMQYAAVWMEDGTSIVQIGMEPVRLLEAMKKNELSYIFSKVTTENGADIYAADPDSLVILGSTAEAAVGKKICEIGICADLVSAEENEFYAKVGGVQSRCVFKRSGAVILGITQTAEALYHGVGRNMTLTALYLLATALLMIQVISAYLDRHILSGISAINEKLAAITGGNLDTKVEVTSTPEFTELSGQINRMVESLLNTTGKLSKVLESVRSPLGVYEYHHDMKRVMTTSRVKEILMLSDQEAETLFSDWEQFEKKLEQIREFPAEHGKDIYRLLGDTERYVKLEACSTEDGVLGMVADATEDVREKQRIERERDIDLLTDVYTRRAFYVRMDELFAAQEKLGCGVLLMADADNLKSVNDVHGHENGDRYLKRISQVLKSCRTKGQVVARLSGDEFALFLYGLEGEKKDREDLQREIDQMRERLLAATVGLTNGSVLAAGFSAGYVFYPEAGTDYHRLLKLSDLALYEAKKRGRCSFEEYHESNAEESRE